jgi:hypothetical protein
MDTFIGLLEITAWIIAVTALAALLTLAMIKITPDRSKKKDEAADEAADEAIES